MTDRLTDTTAIVTHSTHEQQWSIAAGMIITEAITVELHNVLALVLTVCNYHIIIYATSYTYVPTNQLRTIYVYYLLCALKEITGGHLMSYIANTRGSTLQRIIYFTYGQCRTTRTGLRKKKITFDVEKTSSKLPIRTYLVYT